MGVKLTYKQNQLPYRLRQLTKLMPEKASKAMLDLSVEAVREVKNLTSTWKHPPDISINPTKQGYVIEVRGDVFRWLDEGVKKHQIQGNLAFPSAGKGSYVPATRPRVFSSTYAYIQGTVKQIRTEHVNHPGIKPRKFLDELKKKYDDKGTPRVAQAMEDAANQAGV